MDRIFWHFDEYLQQQARWMWQNFAFGSQNFSQNLSSWQSKVPFHAKLEASNPANSRELEVLFWSSWFV
jgi:hypothetical protein